MASVAGTMTAPAPSAAYRWNIIILLTASQMIAYMDRLTCRWPHRC